MSESRKSKARKDRTATASGSRRKQTPAQWAVVTENPPHKAKKILRRSPGDKAVLKAVGRTLRQIGKTEARRELEL